MRGWLLGLLLLLGGSPSLLAQQSDSLPELTITADNPVPVTTVVPVLKPPQVVEMSTTVEEPPAHLSRKERRAWRQERFAQRLDSLVQSRNFIFWPNSMQRYPEGDMHLIYHDYYLLALYVDRVEVHLPVEWGITAYVGVLNFDAAEIEEFAISPMQQGWNIRFRVEKREELYWVDLLVSSHTGETILTLQTPRTTMRYVGVIYPPGQE